MFAKPAKQARPRLARVGRREVSLRDTYEHRAAQRQVGRDERTGRDKWSTEACSQYTSLAHPSPVRNVFAGQDSIGVVDITRERELREKARASKRRDLSSELHPSTGIRHQPPRLCRGPTERDTLERELHEKARRPAPETSPVDKTPFGIFALGVQDPVQAQPMVTRTAHVYPGPPTVVPHPTEHAVPAVSKQSSHRGPMAYQLSREEYICNQQTAQHYKNLSHGSQIAGLLAY